MGLGLLTIVRLVLQVIIARLLGLLSRLDYALPDFIAQVWLPILSCQLIIFKPFHAYCIIIAEVFII